MKASRLIIAILFGISSALFFSCSSLTSPGSVTSAQTILANGVDDALSIALTPVLVKNPSYAPAALALADALGAIAGDQFSTADTDGVLMAVKQKGYAFSDQDEKVIRATINAAWERFAKNYQSLVGANVRPDVKLFVGAAADGIRNAARQASIA